MIGKVSKRSIFKKGGLEDKKSGVETTSVQTGGAGKAKDNSSRQGSHRTDRENCGSKNGWKRESYECRPLLSSGGTRK